MTNLSAQEFENQIKKADAPVLFLNPWAIQNIVYEVITNFYLNNDPKDFGFGFNQRYNSDPTKTTIFVDMAYNWQKSNQDKRPAVFIERGDVDIRQPTMGGTIESDIKESIETRMTVNTMVIKVSVLGTNLGLTESLTEYTKQALISFRQEIQRDFKLRRFRLIKISSPKNIVEPKDHFVVELIIEVIFDEGWAVQGDDLKVKSFGREIYDKVTGRLMSDH